jgi:putative peptidoglycan lipid II flippase
VTGSSRLVEASAEAAATAPDAPSGFANRSGTYVGAVNLVGQVVDRVLAFVQIAIIASVFGATGNADLYFLASIVPLALASTVGEPLARAVLTLLVRGEREEARRAAAAGALFTLAVFGVLTAVYLSIALPLVAHFGVDHRNALGPWIAFGFIAPAMGFCGYLSTLLLWTEQYAWAAIRLPLSTLAGTVLLVVVVELTKGIEWVAAAIAAGYAIAAAVLYLAVAARLGQGWILHADRRSRAAVFALRRKVIGPIVGGIVSGQAIVIIERALAAAISPGSVAVLSYARGIAGAPTTASIAIGAAAYPRLARAEAAGSEEYMRDNYIRGLRLAVFTGAAFTAFFALYASHLIGSLLQRGQFGSGETAPTAHLLVLFALSTFTGSLVFYLVNVLYGIDAFESILWFEGSIFAVYVVLAVSMRAAFGLEGLPLAFGVAQVVGVAASTVMIGRRLGVPAGAYLRSVVAPLVPRLTVLVAALAAYKEAADAVGIAVPAQGIVYVLFGTVVLFVLGSGLLLTAPLPEARALRTAISRRVLGLVR